MYSLPLSFFPQHFMMKIFKYTEKLKELYGEHLLTHQLDSIINTSFYLLYHLSIHLFALSPIHPFIHLFMHFRLSCRQLYNSKFFSMHIIN